MDALLSVLLPAMGCVSAGYLGYRVVLELVRARGAARAYPPVAVARAPDEWHDRCRGTLLGLAVGDALNAPAESLPRWLVRLRYPSGPRMRRGLVRLARRAGAVTDDTQLTIAVARSIGCDGQYDHGRFLEELRHWYAIRIGAGRATTMAAKRARRGHAVTAQPSEGNGAAMRVAPLAIAMAARDGRELDGMVTANAQATHATEAAVAGAVFVALVLVEALRLRPGTLAEPERLSEVLAAAAARAGFRLPIELPAPRDAAELRARLRAVGTSGHVRQSIPAAMLILLAHGLDLEAAMRATFGAGGDTDSIGAIVGAVIGAQLGARGLPARWTRAVQHRDYLCWLADRLASSAPTAPRPRG